MSPNNLASRPFPVRGEAHPSHGIDALIPFGSVAFPGAEGFDLEAVQAESALRLHEDPHRPHRLDFASAPGVDDRPFVHDAHHSTVRREP